MGLWNGILVFNWEDYSIFVFVLKGMNWVYIVYYLDLVVLGVKEVILVFIEVVVKVGLEKVVLLFGKGEVEVEVCEKIVVNLGFNYILVRVFWFN